MTRKKRRMYFIGAGMVMLFAAVALIMNAMEDNLVFFRSPSELQTLEASETRIRLGGMVEEGSVARGGETVEFKVTDYAASTPVVFKGILPDLFREGQGVVVEGKLGPNGVFLASEVLAKHDENYMPPEAAEALARQDPDWAKKLGKTVDAQGAAEAPAPARATN